MKFRLAAIVLGCLSFLPAARAQMSVDQKVSDFRQLATVYAKHYGPYEWKRDVFGFDLFDLRTWLDRVRASKSDLEFWDICVEYVASFRDGHSAFYTPSTFMAYLPLGVDLYDGKLLVDSIDRTELPRFLYPFSIGDEVVSVDGKSPADLIKEFRKYAATGNPVATDRLAADLITFRWQGTMAFAGQTGDTARLAIRRADTGETSMYEIDWIKQGVALENAGPVPPLRVTKAAGKSAKRAAALVDEETGVAFTEGNVGPARELARAAMNTRMADVLRRTVIGFGSRTPSFGLPRGFVQRLGRASGDVFYSGTYTTDDGLRIGFIRIPDYDPAPGVSTALTQWLREIAYFEANTDGLVIDDTRNPGGDACYVHELIHVLTPTDFRTMGYEWRATEQIVQGYAGQVEYEKSIGSEQWVINSWQSHLNALAQANSELRGRSGPIPICGPGLDEHPLTDVTGKPFGYTKPIVVLIDELSASGGDVFPAIMQDNGRAKIVGTRSMGLGGTVTDFKATNFSEGIATATMSLMIRKAPIATGEFPAVPYVENIGVRPDVTADLMTRDNLMNAGRPFVDAFTKVIADDIRAKKQ